MRWLPSALSALVLACGTAAGQDQPAVASPNGSSSAQDLGKAHEQREAALEAAGAGQASASAEAFLAAAALFAQGVDGLEQAKCLHNAGAMFSQAGRHAEAAQAFGRARTASDQVRRSDYAASSALGEGLALAALGREGEAQEAFGIAASLFEQVGDRRQLAMALENRGASLANLSRFDDSAEVYARAEAVARELGDAEGAAHAALGAGRSLRSAERPAEALAALDRALEMAERPKQRGTIRYQRGVVLIRLNRWDEALEHFAAAEQLLSAAGDARDLGWLCFHRGQALMAVGRFDEALGAFDLAEQRTLPGDDDMAAQILQGRGEVLCHRGQFAEALVLFDQVAVAFQQRVRYGRIARLGMLAVRQGEARRSLGHYGRALRHNLDAERWFRRAGHLGQLGSVLLARAEIHAELHRTDDALASYEQARAVFEQMQDQEWLALIDMSLSTTLRKAGDTAGAMAAIERAEPILEEIGNERHLCRLHYDRAALLRDLGRVEEAQATLDAIEDRYLAVGGRNAEADMLSSRAAIHRLLGRTQQALADYERAEAIWEELGLLQQLVRVAGQRGVALAELDRHDEALTSYDLAARRLEDLLAGHVFDLGEASSFSLRTEFAAVVPAWFDSAVALETLSDEALRHGFRVLEVFQGLGMAQLVAGSDRGEASAFPSVASLEEVLAALDPDEAMVHVSALGQQVHALLVTKAGPRLLLLGNTGQVDEAVAAVARRLDPSLRGLPPVPAELSADLRALGRLVLDPILTALAETPGAARPWRLLIAPSGSLCRVPFEALLTADVEADAAPATWPHLVRDVDVAYVHSATTWLALQRRAQTTRPRAGPEYVALAHPRYDGPPSAAQDGGTDGVLMDVLRGGRSLAPLPRTADEVYAVARLLSKHEQDEATLDVLADALLFGELERIDPVEGDNFLILLRDQATEQQLKQRTEVRTARILHLACHGAADTRSPGLSRLLLGSAAGEDGLLFVDELAGLELSCELLVLSACETNAGPLRPLEGVDGLSRAGLAAGAGAVLSTLWQVQDEGARRLIVSFHEGWLKGGHSRISALAEAKRHAIRQGVAVATWSAFLLWDGDTAN